MSEDQLRSVVRSAVSEGIRDAWADPGFWDAAIKAFQARAQVEAGGWLLGSLKTVVSRAAWLVVVGLGVYLLGGWSALISLFKSTIGGGSGS